MYSHHAMHGSYSEKFGNIPVRTKDQGQRTGDGGTQNGKQRKKDRNRGIEQLKRGHWDRTGNKEQRRETG
jgi:hypothetical protein